MWTASSDSWCQSMIPSLASSQAEALQSNLCCQAAAREVSSCQQETLHGFHRPGECVWSSTSEGHLLGAEKLGVEEWIVRLVQRMYANAGSHVRVGEGYSEEFEMKVGVHQDQYSARCSSSLCLKPYHESSTLGSPGRTSMLMTLLSSLNRLRNVSGGSSLGK